MNKEQLLARQKELKDKIERLNTKQHCIKVFINSVYGFFGNKHASFGDDDIAASITLTGQAVIKQAAELSAEFINKNYNLNVTASDVRTYGDTDSLYISLNKIPDLNFSENGKITKETYSVVDKIEKYINNGISKWAKSALNSKDSRFLFKRESLADTGIFLEKKRYVLHVLDDEGINCDKWKYTGVEVVRTTMPRAIKPYVKCIIENMLTTYSQSSTNTILMNAYNTFKRLDIKDTAFTSSIRNYDKYASKCSEFKTALRMPCHVKAAYFYNLILKKLNLDTKYESIADGDKIKYIYVERPNKYGIDAIAFKYKFPEELKSIFIPDKEKMFNKIVYSCVERFYDAVNWVPRKPSEAVQTDLFDLFGI